MNATNVKEYKERNNKRRDEDVPEIRGAVDDIYRLLGYIETLQSQLAQVTQEPLAATIDILEQRRRQLGTESIPEYARTINFLQAIVDEKKKEYPPLRAARSNYES